MTEKKTTYLKLTGEEICHELWSTPVIMAKPFSNAFLEQLRKDMKPFITGPGAYNQNDLWNLSDEWISKGYVLPDTMLEVKNKMLELTDKYFRPHAEQPLPPLRIGKGYFRTTYPGEYKMSPHKHSTTYGIGVFYVNAEKRNPGNLVIMDPRGGVNWVNQFSPYKRIPVEEGMMVIHPGYLLHFVEPTDPRNPDYEYRVAIVSAIHRSYDDFLQILKETEGELAAFGANGVTQEEMMRRIGD
jgi:hypothetical protein